MNKLNTIKSIFEKYGIDKNKIQLSTPIQSLGLGPEEIDDFFDEFGKTFQINGKGYNYNNYFYEKVHPLIMIKELILKIINPSKIKKISITIEHLLNVAERGKWFNPE